MFIFCIWISRPEALYKAINQSKQENNNGHNNLFCNGLFQTSVDIYYTMVINNRSFNMHLGKAKMKTIKQGNETMDKFEFKMKFFNWLKVQIKDDYYRRGEILKCCQRAIKHFCIEFDYKTEGEDIQFENELLWEVADYINSMNYHQFEYYRSRCIVLKDTIQNAYGVLQIHFKE